MSFVRASMLLLVTAVTVNAQQLPPVRPLGAPIATTTESFPSIPSVRVLSDGRVMVSDMTRRRLVLFDSMLTRGQPVLNPTGAAATQYPARGGNLFSLRHDTTLVFDAAGYSFVVLDGAGQVARVIAVPRAMDVFLLSGPYGTPVVDDRMRMIYRTTPRATGYSPVTGMAIVPDSAAIVAVSFDTRQADTLGWMKIPRSVPSVSTVESDGKRHITFIAQPFQLTDEWAALQDGTLALIRWRDYHVDWVLPDGRKESSPRTAWKWERMGDEEKVRFIDTLKFINLKNDSVQNQSIASSGPITAAPVFETLTPSPSELPDYPPPFVSRQTRVDPEGRIWVMERAKLGETGPLVYDVIDRSGQIVDRVSMPPNAAVIGFGPGGTVILSITPLNNNLAASVPPIYSPSAGPTGIATSVKVARAVLPRRTQAPPP